MTFYLQTNDSFVILFMSHIHLSLSFVNMESAMHNFILKRLHTLFDKVLNLGVNLLLTRNPA